MRDSVLVFIFSNLDGKHPFWTNLIQKTKIVSFKLKFGTKTNSNMQNSMVVFTFFVFYRKHPYWRTKVKKSAIFVPANWSREFEISSCHQHSFFIFCGECVRELFLGTSIKYFGIIQKEKQTFYFI